MATLEGLTLGLKTDSESIFFLQELRKPSASMHRMSDRTIAPIPYFTA